jgi:hypothetical protein
MRQAISVIATALMDGRLKFETSEAQAADILDSLNAAGFQIMEPSDKVFNSPDPLRDQLAMAALPALLTVEPAWDASTASEAYAIADAMIKQREKRYEN